MGYKVLPQKDIQSPTAYDSESDHVYPSQRRISISIYTLVGLCSTTLISVLVLLVLFMLRDSHQCVVQDNGWNISARYGRNESRMSLDHEHDHLWSDFEMTPGFGIIRKSDFGDKQISSVSISMYVSDHGRHVCWY